MTTSDSAAIPGPSRVPLLWLARLWLLGVALMLAIDWLNESFDLGWMKRIYFWSTLIMSAWCFLAYGVDKRRAVREKQRISEKQLHVLAILGGWPGAVIAQQMFRHKTLKMSFRLVLWAIVAVHVGLSAYFVYAAVQQKQRRDRMLEDPRTASVSVRGSDQFPGENFRFLKKI